MWRQQIPHCSERHVMMMVRLVLIGRKMMVMLMLLMMHVFRLENCRCDLHLT